ncbi:hypothetical protein CLV56_2740 [Mumia flava]|uniref:Htaa protein n=1 Tax=Mumia flava TaxID=1348852 RepID=A0A0B2BI16_9ACTN|nr:hypothetical protein [Mumia flava]PJJ58489.1 hypothetical protein CLV56_2740 [Mumia flava]
MRRIVVAVCAALVALTVPWAVAWGEESATTAREVTSATLRWGLSNEANNAAFAPGTYNFLSAGEVPDPGGPGQEVPRSDWSASAPGVRIEKRRADGSYGLATWAGLTTDANGVSTRPATNGVFSDHQVVLDDASGWVDPTSGRAEVTWDGTFSAVAYSGMTFFVVSDPVLSVRSNGTGTLTATLSGYGSSQSDPNAWNPVSPRTVTMATLSGVSVGDDGTVVTPDYAGVAATGVSTPQNRSQSGWGAWPQSFLDFQTVAGSAEYWYSTGSSVDAYKAPLPIELAWTLAGDVVVDPEEPEPTDPTPTAPEPTGPTPTTPTSPGSGTGGGGTASGTFTVDDAQLRWGVSNETNNAAHAPGTYNFFSAGSVPDPGRGGETIHERDWSAHDGDVRIEKATSAGTYRLATWKGLSTAPDGGALTSASSGVFSDHQVVLDGGSGTVDVKRRKATVRWTGTFTVLLYSGMSFFSVSDPVLKVRDGVGRIDATLSGYASDRDDTSVWEPVAPRSVRLANLGRVSLERSRGFSARPSYAGVRYSAPSGSIAQNRSADGWGAFPSSFLRFVEKIGTAAFFYSTGSSTDRFKAPLPVTVSYEASTPAKVPADDDDPADGSAGGTTSSPATTAAPTGAASPAPAPAVGAAAPAPLSTGTASDTVVGAAVPVGTTEGIQPVAATTPAAPPASWPWWAGAAMAVGAVAVTIGSRLLTRRPSP